MALLTVGVPGAIANIEGQPPAPASGEAMVNTSAAVAPAGAAAIEPAIAQPRFSQLRARVNGLLSNPAPSSAPSLAAARLEDHRQKLNHRSNEVESQLLSVQQLLSIQSYGTSFADRLLAEDADYQAKLQQLQTQEAELHRALGQTDPTRLAQLRRRVQLTEQALQQRSQLQLQRHIEQAQASSTLGLWQEPMYLGSLRWLMEHTHERHLLKAQQQTLARTLIATAAEPGE